MKKSKRRGFLRISGIVLAVVMILSDLTGFYPAMKAQAATCQINVYPVYADMGTTTGTGAYNFGSTVTATANPKPGYEFVYWWDGDKQIMDFSNPCVFNAQWDRTLIAMFKKTGQRALILTTDEVDRNCNIFAVGEETGNYPNYTLKYFTPGETIKLSCTTGVSTELDTYLYSADGQNYAPIEDTFVMPDFDIFISARFRSVFPYSVTIDPNIQHGTITTGDGRASYKEGENVTLILHPEPGYRLESISGMPADNMYADGEYTFKMPRAKVEISAVFGIDPRNLTLTAFPEEGGVLSYELSSVDTATVSATPNLGYKFTGWHAGYYKPNGALLSTDSKYTFLYLSSDTMTGVFEKLGAYTLYPNLELQNGSIAVANYHKYYDEGDEIKLILTPDKGYAVDAVYHGVLTDDGLTELEEIDGNKFLMPAQDTWVYATFVPGYDVTATASPDLGGTVTGAGAYKPNATVTLKATAYKDYEFVNWTEDGDEVSDAATYQFTATENRTLVANFKKTAVYENSFYDGFEDNKINEWTLIDSDGDGQGWNVFSANQYYGNQYVGSGRMALRSVASEGLHGLDPDEWAITPAIVAPENAKLSFWMTQYGAVLNGPDKLGVYVGLSPETDKMTKLKDFTIEDREDRMCRIDLSAYAGQKIYLGFRHYDSPRGKVLIIDNVEVRGQGSFWADDNLKITKKSLSLHDTIAIDFKVPKSAVADYFDPYLLVTQNELTSKVTQYYEDGDLLIFTYRVPPQMMREQAVAVPHASNAQNEDVVGEAFTYSVAEYCYNMLGKDKYQSDEFASLRRLLVDILHYGDAAQVYANYKTDELAGKDLTAAQQEMGTDVNAEMTYNTVKDKDFAKVDAEDELASIDKAALYLEGAVNVQFKYSANDVSGLRMVITDDEACTNVIAEYAANPNLMDDNGLYYVTVNALNAGQMRKTIYATMMKGDRKVSNSYRYSIESYVKSMKGRGIQNLDELLDAMMRYGDSAAAYANN